MKRRHFCSYFMLGTLLGGFLPEQFRSSMLKPAIAQTSAQLHYRWLVLYWMPYDNDLSRFGEPIVDMLTRGMDSLNTSNLPLEAAYNSPDNSSTTNDPDIASDIAVILQSDYRKDRQMRRRVFSQDQVQEIAIAGEDSSDVNALTNYLDWARQNFIADHWAVIVVGHGGKINEISPDYHGDSLLESLHPSHTWMGVDQFTRAVANFNQSVGERVELLFFQNCHKATLEVIYEARNCARYTLASQLELGAPNYYYEEFLQKLKDMAGVGWSQESPSGRQAAMAIINAERADMYHTFTLIENRFVEQIPEKLAKVVASIPEGATVGRSPLALRRNIDTYEYFGERHCDVLVLLNYLFRNHRTNDQKALKEFSEFLFSSVISHYQIGGLFYGRRLLQFARESCGLSLYFPETIDTINRYENLGLYSQGNLLGLYQKMFAS